jgi:5-methylcytosine-specific restriction endonuclease McrA
MIPSAEAQLLFLQRVQRILDEGSFTASYKYALLLALADLAVEKGDDSGGELPISLDDIAEKFIHYYWRQARPYPLAASGAAEVLWQNNRGQAEIITVVGKHLHLTMAQLKQDSVAWKRLVGRTRRTIVTMPLSKLQNVGSQTIEFLYPCTTSTIVLNPGVAFCLRRFHTLIYDLVTAAWLRFVRGLSQNQRLLGQATDLSEFLFGTERANLGRLRPILAEIQKETCFYCQKPLDGSGDVDHFVPWSRYPVDLGHNFVLADSPCNNQKRETLAALPHLERWVRRNDDFGKELAEQFDRKRVVHDSATSRGVTDWAYSQAYAASALTWVRGKVFVELPPDWASTVGL